MADEPHAYFTYICPRTWQPTILYTAREFRALGQGTTLRQGQRCPSCGGHHAFTKEDLRAVDRRRPSRLWREAAAGAWGAESA